MTKMMRLDVKKKKKKTTLLVVVEQRRRRRRRKVARKLVGRAGLLAAQQVSLFL